MGYFSANKENKNIIQFNLNELHLFVLREIIKNHTVSQDKESPSGFYFQSSQISEIADEILKRLREDLNETINDSNLNKIDTNYFFWKKNPITKKSSFSCELVKPEGGKVIYDIVRLVKHKESYYLFLPES